MKRGIFVILFVILSISLINASFELGENTSYEIDTSYGISEAIKGWVNISFSDEPASSVLNAFDNEIILKDFLDLNGFNCKTSSSCSCFPSDCEKAYSSSNAESLKQFSLGYFEEKLIGMKITKDVDSITNFRFNVSTNDDKSCTHPLKIDLLDDGIIEWKSTDMSDEFCQIANPKGCFKESDSKDTTEIKTGFLYCQKIKIPVNKKLRPGAEVIGSGDATFEFTITTSLEDNSCTASSNTSGEIKCSNPILFDEELEESEQATVCMTKLSGSSYNIKYEDNEPCGYSEVESTGVQVPYDFNIFVEAGKYNSVDDFQFNQEEVYGDSGSDLTDYIYYNNIIDKYGGKCDPECIIPIRIYSGINQEITISNLSLEYSSNNLPDDNSNIYDLAETEILISSDFLKLDLEKGNFLTPDDLGDKTFILKLDNQTILEKNIKVKAVPKIINIIPQNVSALVTYSFIVILENKNNLTYTWDFGDGSKQTTNENVAEHAYSSLGNYSLKVTVSSNSGNSSKTVNINVGSPKDYINSTITNYEDKLNEIESEINKLDSWIQTEVKKEFDIDDIKSQINNQKNKYESAFSDDDYVKIMEALIALNIPDSFNLSQKLSPSNIFPDPNQINLPALDYFGAGGIEGTEEDYSNAVTNWFTEAMQMTVESKTFALYYENEVEDLFSYVRVTLTPKQENLGDVYFIVNGNPDEIKFNTKNIEGRIKDYDDAAGVVFPELASAEVIEFLYPGKISIVELPIYVYPEFRNLEIQEKPGVCNFNKRCEKELGENYKNCRNDCKPVGKTILWILILLFIALIVYVILQEWYKRHYEKHLFKDRNQLFNLINFMNNSYNQGMRKADIFDKLKDLGWEGEQLRYAWNKLQGKRTGMWEIPLFKWIEKRQVKKELAKRGSSTNNFQRFRRV